MYYCIIFYSDELYLSILYIKYEILIELSIMILYFIYFTKLYIIKKCIIKLSINMLKFILKSIKFTKSLLCSQIKK